MPALLALASAVVFGAADFTGGYAARRRSVVTVTLVSNAVGIVLALALVTVDPGVWTATSVGWGAAGGACGLVGLLALYRGLAVGPNRLVSPLSGVIAAILPVFFGLVGGDRPDRLAVSGILLTPIAIWLVAGGDHRVAGAARSLQLGLAAGAGFGLFFVCLDQTPDDAGSVPLLAARVTSTAILVLVSARQDGARPTRRDLALPGLTGVLDMTANALFLWSTRDGDLSVVGALVNLYPVTTILLAVAILHERLTRAQGIGLVLAVSAAALLS